MAVDTVVRTTHQILYVLLIAFAIVEGSISGWLVARFNRHHNYPNKGVRDKVRYLLFVSWWTFLFGTLLLVVSFVEGEGVVTSVAAHGIFLGLTWILWFAGAVAITRGLHGGTNCSTVHYNLVYCNQLNSVIAFAWGAWALTFILLFVVLFRGITTLRREEPSGQAAAA